MFLLLLAILGILLAVFNIVFPHTVINEPLVFSCILSIHFHCFPTFSYLSHPYLLSISVFNIWYGLQGRGKTEIWDGLKRKQMNKKDYVSNQSFFSIQKQNWNIYIPICRGGEQLNQKIRLFTEKKEKNPNILVNIEHATPPPDTFLGHLKGSKGCGSNPCLAANWKLGWGRVQISTLFYPCQVSGLTRRIGI